jgi:hypothetical protein
MRIKQRQVLPGVDKAVSNATKVYVNEACVANDVLVATGVKNGFLSVVKASKSDITKCRGPFFVADYAAALGDYVAVALPWKLVTNADTSTAAQAGDPVWLNTAGGVTFGSPPAAVSGGGSSAFAAVVKVGHVVRVHASTGGYLLEPGIADGAPLCGSTTRTGTGATLVVTGITAEFNGAPVVATSSATEYVVSANIAGGDLTITASANTTSTFSYMILA